MRIDEFRAWLSHKRTKRAVCDCISRCKKVESVLEINLDQEYLTDFGSSVYKSLLYGKREADKGVVFPTSFGFKPNCNQIQRFTDLRASVKQYFLFCSEHPVNVEPQNR